MLVAGAPRLLGVEVPKDVLKNQSRAADVAIHVTGRARKDLLLGLRTLASLTSGLGTYREILGGEIMIGQEPAGFYSGPDLSGDPITPDVIEAVAKITAGAQAGGTWLLYQEVRIRSRQGLGSVGGRTARSGWCHPCASRS